MIIVAGGDSFVFGSELKDSPNGHPTSYSRSTFTALLSSSEYYCVAYPGYSNADIVTNIKRILKIVPECPFIIVCWTWPSRDTVYTSPRVIREFQHYCEYHNFPYMFTCADNCLIPLLDNINDNWFLFPAGTMPHDTMSPRGFYQWAVENKYLVGPQDHPLEEAHLDASKLMQEKFNELVKKHIQQNSIRNSIS
jgi:hypothetical protein